MRLLWVLLGVSALVACGGDDGQTPTACASNVDCAGNESCLASRCVANGSLALGAVCTTTKQCKHTLRCEDQICKGGCTDFFGTQGCVEGTWCKPTDTGGACVAPECGESVAAVCVGDASCIPVGADMGACLVRCTYGFVGENYLDDCADPGGVDQACQSAGIADQAVCLPTGLLAAGEPGCNAITAPCAKGSVCVDVVCRTLCLENQGADCPIGESCIPLSPASDVYICGVP